MREGRLGCPGSSSTQLGPFLVVLLVLYCTGMVAAPRFQFPLGSRPLGTGGRKKQSGPHPLFNRHTHTRTQGQKVASPAGDVLRICVVSTTPSSSVLANGRGPSPVRTDGGWNASGDR